MKNILIYHSSIYFTLSLIETLINQVLLKEQYNSFATVWRSTEELGAHAPLFLLVYLLFTISFGAIFRTSYQGRGLGEGALLGLGLGVLVKFWYGFTNLVVLPISLTLGFLWFFYGTLEVLVLGILSAYIIDKLAIKGSKGN